MPKLHSRAAIKSPLRPASQPTLPVSRNALGTPFCPLALARAAYANRVGHMRSVRGTRMQPRVNRRSTISHRSKQSAIWGVVSPFEKVGARLVPSNSKTARRATLSDDGQTGNYPSIGNGKRSSSDRPIAGEKPTSPGRSSVGTPACHAGGCGFGVAPAIFLLRGFREARPVSGI
jgi:hypothetical protein